MPPRLALSLTLSWLALTCAGHAQSQEFTFTWKDEPRTVEALRADAPLVAEAAARWLPFVDSLGYRLVVSDDRRVLLALSKSFARRQPKKEHHEVEVMLDLVRDTVAATERFLGPPAKDAEPLVMLCARAADYPRIVQKVGTLDPRLKEWSERAGQAVTGFILSEPLLASWIEDPAGVEEWHPYNELVHRTAQLLVRGRAPRLPAWLQLGLAWHVEDTVRGCVYCFPHRATFVSAAEHTDWGLWLANNFKKDKRDKLKKPASLAMAEFADWRPQDEKDEFETGKAYVAFGVARYLAHESAAKVLPLVQRFSEATAKGSKVMVSDTEWKTNPDYQLSSAEQLALLTAVDDKLLAKVTDYFQKKKANERRAVGKPSR